MNTDIFSLNSPAPQDSPAINKSERTNDISQKSDNEAKFGSILKSQTKVKLEQQHRQEKRLQKTQDGRELNKRNSELNEKSRELTEKSRELTEKSRELTEKNKIVKAETVAQKLEVKPELKPEVKIKLKSELSGISDPEEVTDVENNLNTEVNSDQIFLHVHVEEISTAEITQQESVDVNTLNLSSDDAAEILQTSVTNPSVSQTSVEAEHTESITNLEDKSDINTPATIAVPLTTAGSITSQSVKDLLQNQTLSKLNEEQTNTENFRSSGKIIPPNGNSTLMGQPGKTSIEFQSGAATSENTLLNNNTAELLNKNTSFSQLLTSNEGQPLLPTPVSAVTADESSLTPIINGLTNSGTTLNGSEKLLNNRGILSTPTFNIEAPFGSDEWHGEINNRIRWLGKLNISSAELQLHPAELGAIEIKISTENDQTKVSFFSNNSVTREMIESSMPRLRELLSDSGLQLEQSDVSEQTLAEHTRDQNDNRHKTGQELSEQEQINEASPTKISRFSNNQVNHYV